MNEVIGIDTLALYAVGSAALFVAVKKARARAQLSFAKHRSLAGHPRMARRVAALLPSYTYEEDQAFAVDGAPPDVVAKRRAAFESLIERCQARYPKTLQAGAEAAETLSDLQFVSAYRTPFQFRKLAAKGLKVGSFVQSTEGVTVTDLDGNRFYDLTGSYGVNLFGNDFYKDCMDRGADIVRVVGPVLGAYHPVVLDNLQRIKTISGMEEVSFHMSGTEAVMQAVRLARYHTGRKKLVRFCGSYHGWWGDVQPGIGNPMPATDTLNLTEMGEGTLRVLRSRRDIACVLINPLQALHPNAPAPSDGALLDSSRKAHFDKAAYTAWLQELRRICDARCIALIFDEVFMGFRLAKGGAQEYFGVRADLVTYGKTLGGGLPVGVVCGKRVWMRRFREGSPADICFARGTFNAHPYVMAAMNVFLKRLEDEDIATLYAHVDATWSQRAALMNTRLQQAGLPVQVADMSTVWTVLYTQPASFNWLFQHYLRQEGVALSWVGSARIIWSLNFSDEEFEQVLQCFVRAGLAMQADGWWWTDGLTTNKTIKRRLLREMLAAKFA
ncbi:glutamate-1-semialdehyde 2,1-aminomutase [Rhodoferax lacus]|uniref:Glutamate-1-semialdehyde 2,1-aminomutase n=1 Tax=Rhodoferax lacus TaxID=2184758 RepID=A0A3E1R8Q3_9BURK|nr:aminotransferase class III-fold pyridoxal phosphate-dependent enzyme [Rhodoferax lacus]RFO95744.1 glutamate-1-semialdehyde 2,1-aminomutase [Rhodoferax lacus]